MYRRWKESKGKDKEYENIIKYGASLTLAFCFALWALLRSDVYDYFEFKETSEFIQN